MQLVNGFPLYQALMLCEDDGLFKISLVDAPAVQSNFLAFDEDREELKYSVQNDDEKIVFGVLMRANYPIFRNTERGKFYVEYSEDTIKQMAMKMLADGTQNNFNLGHKQGTDFEGVRMIQCFIKDSKNGISPTGFDDIEDGSLFASFHIENDDIWQQIKEGKYKGFSLEGVFSIEPVMDDEDKEINEIMSLIDKIIKK